MKENFKVIRKRLVKYVNMLMSENGYMYAGYPRFMELFGRDSIISAVELFHLYPEILKKTLISLAGQQGKVYNAETGEEPGKIPHELANPETFRYYPEKEKWVKPNVPLYYSVDSTPLFVFACELYIKNTNDSDFLNYIRAYMDRAVSMMIKKSQKTGFLTYNASEIENRLATQGWMDGSWGIYGKLSGDIALIEVQGYFYQSLKIYNELFPGNPVAKVIADRLNFMENYIDPYFWMEDQEYYSPAVFFSGKDRERIDTVSSSAGHLLLTEIVSRNRKKSMVKRIFQDDMATPWGIRTISSESKCFDPYKYQSGSIWPHDNWIILHGLRHSGFNEEAELLESYILNAISSVKYPYEYYSVDLNNNIINMEMLEVPPCMPQAWSTGAFIGVLDNKS